MADFQADLKALVAAANAWNDTAKGLTNASGKAKDIAQSHTEVTNWGLFDKSWAANVTAANYVRDRLNEANSQAEGMSAVLSHVAQVYGAHDSDLANSLNSMATEISAGS